MQDVSEEIFPGYMLCGFIPIVLSLNQSPNLSLGTHCELFSNQSSSDALGFRTDDGVHLTLVEANVSKKKSRRKGVGIVNVVNQLHVLVNRKCLKIRCRVVGVSSGDREGEKRVVVLVDVYLLNGLWGGLQFPKRGATVAASLFTHVSCDWGWRNVMFLGNLEFEDVIWEHSDCHVLGCKLHLYVPESSKKGLFDLHEIFKSLPGIAKRENTFLTSLKPADASFSSGIWELSDDVLINNVLCALGTKELVRVASTCRHLKSLAESIMPCLMLKLFPHQQAAVEWMLHRERRDQVLAHPLYMDSSTEDGFSYYINAVSGEIESGIAPTVKDFCGGMFCDEPGLGKTITSLSLILKTKGTMADPPDSVEVVWCMHNHDQRCGYYELTADNYVHGNFMPSLKRIMRQNGRRGQISTETLTPPRGNSSANEQYLLLVTCPSKIEASTSSTSSLPAARVLRSRKSLSGVKRNLLGMYEEKSALSKKCKVGSSSSMYNETWAQCDGCKKWRRLSQASSPVSTTAWFCSMNSDPGYQNCKVPEESWDNGQPITYLPGFHTKESPGGLDENVTFFTSVLKEHHALINSKTKKAITWLAKLPQNKLLEMETIGLTRPVLDTRSVGVTHEYKNIFQAFGLVRRVVKGITRWCYPLALDNLALDVIALQVALTKPLDTFRLYLSRATLIVVPANLVDHWQTQIQNHVRPGHLRVYEWTDYKTPPVHNLAWDYDVVITTFSRLSAEWRTSKRSVMMQVHWLRVMLDEGHTLGSSLSVTNKLQMAISLTASNRWLLTGTPTPNTPNSQISHLQPMLKFLHEEVYGQNQKSWEAGIIRPFEAEMEEGRLRLLQLLQRCMISARKIDLQAIPPCNKKVIYVNFTEEHAKSYNELVVTVRRNILMADWNDPSHVESLLNPKQWKFRSTTIRNVRLSCCVAGHIKVTDAGHDIQETMDILVKQGLDPVAEEYAFIRRSMLDGCSCFRCQEWCRLPVITPCKHLLCLACVALDSEKCSYPGCGNPYEMQSPEILTRPENPNPKWPVPKDLIELQPSYKQDDWDPDWQSTSSSKVSYLVGKLKSLHEDQSRQKMSPPDKVIIFSQFLEHIHIIEQQLAVAGISFVGMYSPMQLNNKRKSLISFRDDESCMALLMDGSAALGLDLSFVNHVFLMEPIWDRSMEEQVISRAHRMGATRPINVEILAMCGTIEERMCEILQPIATLLMFKESKIEDRIPLENIKACLGAASLSHATSAHVGDGCCFLSPSQVDFVSNIPFAVNFHIIVSSLDTDRCRALREEFGSTEHEGTRLRRSTLHDFAQSSYLSELSFVRNRAKP
ncbi:hypothetical protein GIB67_034765 [Kingdonia uniflora]|uniref:F-box protein n=1 Tax=Kingdonia uniflora TaxID=39325 RepID=A0A7J7MDQ4_9MAGN|nr:hypothetical protein GIB67_034765 [Kingdonia uniflora]